MSIIKTTYRITQNCSVPFFCSPGLFQAKKHLVSTTLSQMSFFVCPCLKTDSNGYFVVEMKMSLGTHEYS